MLQVTGGDLRDFFGKSDDVLVGVKRGGVLQAIDLCVDFRGDLRIAMPYGDGKDAAKEVEVLVAVEIPNVLHLAAVGDQRVF